MVSLRAKDDDGEEIMWTGGDSIIGAEEERPDPEATDALLLPDDEAEDLYLDRYDNLHGDKF